MMSLPNGFLHLPSDWQKTHLMQTAKTEYAVDVDVQ
jgi:hypothetical protein